MDLLPVGTVRGATDHATKRIQRLEKIWMSMAAKRAEVQ